MQPALEPRIVHVGLPTVQGESLTTADNCGELALRQPGEIDVAPCGIGPSQLQVLGSRQRVHIGNVPFLPAANLDAERIDQHQLREPGGRAHYHLRRNPAAEASADEYSILEPEFCG